MKNFHWGHKITIVIVVFIVTMLSMVYVTFQQTNEMVDANYYDKELKYQGKIDAAKKLNEAHLENLLKQDSEWVILNIPSTLKTDFQNGTIEFLRNDDSKKDIKLKFQPDTEGNFRIEKNKFIKGFYNARISWDNSSNQYYKEEQISINF